MKVLASLKSAKNRDKDCRLIRRKGKLLVINKKKILDLKRNKDSYV